MTPHISRNPDLRFLLDSTQTRATGLMRSTHYSHAQSPTACATLDWRLVQYLWVKLMFFPLISVEYVYQYTLLWFFCVQRMKLRVILRASACEEKLHQFSNMADRNLILLSWLLIKLFNQTAYPSLNGMELKHYPYLWNLADILHFPLWKLTSMHWFSFANHNLRVKNPESILALSDQGTISFPRFNFPSWRNN